MKNKQTKTDLRKCKKTGYGRPSYLLLTDNKVSLVVLGVIA